MSALRAFISGLVFLGTIAGGAFAFEVISDWLISPPD